MGLLEKLFTKKKGKYKTDKVNENGENAIHTNESENSEYILLGHIGTSSFDFEDVRLFKKDDKWFVKNVAMWPAHRGASNGGEFITELTDSFFADHNIYTVDAFLQHFLIGKLRSCLDKASKKEDVVKTIEGIIIENTNKKQE